MPTQQLNKFMKTTDFTSPRQVIKLVANLTVPAGAKSDGQYFETIVPVAPGQYLENTTITVQDIGGKTRHFPTDSFYYYYPDQSWAILFSVYRKDGANYALRAAFDTDMGVPVTTRGFQATATIHLSIMPL